MVKNSDIPILYHSKTSVCSQKVRLVLAELNVEWQGVFLDLKKGEQFLPQYLSLNPKASVPAFVDGDRCLTESNDIMLYLAQDKNVSTHLNIDQKKLNDVSAWLDEAVRFHQAVHVLTTLSLNREKLLAMSPEELTEKFNRVPDKARAQRLYDVVQNGLEGIAASSAVIYLQNIFQRLETQLQNSEFLCSDNVTLADLAILPFVMRVEFLHLKPDWSEKRFSALENWLDRLKQRSSFEDAIMAFHSEQAIEKYKTSGLSIRQELENL